MRLVAWLLCLAGITTTTTHAFSITNAKYLTAKRPIRPTTNRLSSPPISSPTSRPFVLPQPSFPAPISPSSAFIRTILVRGFIGSMCLTLPVLLMFVKILFLLKIINTKQKEHLSLRVGGFTCCWLLRIFRFTKLEATPPPSFSDDEPLVWVCNHVGMLDIFFMLGTSKRIRGKHARPIKVIYWKDLEKNPVTKCLFKMCGFIPVEMAANGAGEENEYDKATFKKLLKDVKQCFKDGFDLGILPEGQLNPKPELGLSKTLYSGAFTLAKMSKRKIVFMGLYNTHAFWHANKEIGLTVSSDFVKIKNFGRPKLYKSSEEFLEAFKCVVGSFGLDGVGLSEDELDAVLN